MLADKGHITSSPCVHVHVFRMAHQTKGTLCGEFNSLDCLLFSVGCGT